LALGLVVAAGVAARPGAARSVRLTLVNNTESPLVVTVVRPGDRREFPVGEARPNLESRFTIADFNPGDVVDLVAQRVNGGAEFRKDRFKLTARVRWVVP
jgi:hypothetical protein